MKKNGKILIVDDNEDILFSLDVILGPLVEKIKSTTHPENIPQLMDEFAPDLILLDMNFRKDVSSGTEGFDWLARILKKEPAAVVVMMTAYSDTTKAVQAIKAGAVDFIPKPWERDRLIATVNSALKLREVSEKNKILQTQLTSINSENSCPMIGECDEMKEVFSLIEKVASADANILILGENGTGKDLVARNIHNRSMRNNQIFSAIDLGTISESLFESELFGYERGAFTDAKQDKPGRMEIASGGTLFLDEIANLSTSMQSKILTVLEKKYVSRLGSTKNIPIDVRFISATNSDIYSDVEHGLFRRDLLYRINTIEIYIPPLRERGDDIVLLSNHFLEKFRIKYKKEIHGLSKEAIKKLEAYHWPGNVRELQNAIERAVIMSSGPQIKADELLLNTVGRGHKKTMENLNLEAVEQSTIRKAIEQANGNLNKAASLLGISRFSLYRKINRNE